MASLKPLTQISDALKGLLNDGVARETRSASSICGSMYSGAALKALP